MDFFENMFGSKVTSRKVHVYTQDEAVNMLRKGKDKVELQGNIVLVDFSKINHFRDASYAHVCLVILSSNGTIGTISHLQLNTDPQEIVDKLYSVYSQKGVPICLAGGEAGTSDLLVDNTIGALKSKGFIVSTKSDHADILSPQGRFEYTHSTLYKDKVEVVKTPYSGHKSSTTLRFPVIK